MKLRILPLIITAYAMIAVIKLGDVLKVFGSDSSSKMSIISELNPKTAMAVENNSEKEVDLPNQESNETDLKQPDEKKIVNDDNTNISTHRPQEITELQNNCNAFDFDLLQTLSKRREELTSWSNEATNKANILQATELKIDHKLKELNSLKKEIKLLLDDYNEKENTKINTLVKIYETMKPKDAAQIFERLEMPVILQVINKMKEAKVASILSNMNPARAREITTEFIEKQKLPEPSEMN